MGISSGPMTLKFWQSPHFKNCDFEKEKYVWVPLKSCQVCKKWLSEHADHSGKRWAIGWFFPIFFSGWNLIILLLFYLFITSSSLTKIILNICICMHWHILAPFIYYISKFYVQLIPSLLLLLFFDVIIINDVDIVSSPFSLLQVCWSIVQVIHKLDFILDDPYSSLKEFG